MKATWVLSGCLLLTGLLFATSLYADQTLKSKDGEIQLTLPDGWKEKSTENASITIDAENVAKHEYVMVLSEASADFADPFEKYAKDRAVAMGDKLDDSTVSDVKPVKANGKDALQYEIHGITKSPRVKVAYLLTVVKGDSHFIQVVGWATESKFAAGLKDFAALPDGISEVAK